MKKLSALLLALVLLLSLAPAALAEPEPWRLDSSSAELNCISNTIAVKRIYYYELIDAEGQVLVPESEKYTLISPVDHQPYFDAYKDAGSSGDGLHRRGLLAGDGTLLLPAVYADVKILSERWQIGLILTETDEANAEYTAYNFPGGKSFYRVDTADVYFDGQLVGSLSRDAYSGGYPTAHGAYISFESTEGKRRFFDRELEPSPYSSSYSFEFDTRYENGETVYYHQGSGQIAFQPECTLDPADLENPYLYKDGAVYNIRGEKLLDALDYDEVSSFHDGYAITYKDRKKGLLSLDDGELLPTVYHALGNNEEHPFRYGYISVIKNGKLGFLDAQGQISVPLDYDGIKADNYSTFAVVDDPEGGFRVISAAVGELPLPFAGAEFPCQDGCMAFVAMNEEGQYAVYDLYGQELLPFTDCKGIQVSVDGSVLLVDRGVLGYDVYLLNTGMLADGGDQVIEIDDDQMSAGF